MSKAVTSTTIGFEEWVDEVEAKFDAFVEHGSDHELFLSGYLHGHFSLVVSQAELAGETSIEAVDKRMMKSLLNAFTDKELEMHDQKHVTQMWHTLAEVKTP